MLGKDIKQALNNAARFAKKCGAGEIQSEHLMYGILMVEESLAVKVLNKFGITKDSYFNAVKPHLEFNQEKINDDIK